MRDENEIYFSYESRLDEHVQRLYSTLEDSYAISLSKSQHGEETQMQKAGRIRKAKVFMCFLTQHYIYSPECGQELKYAVGLDKQIVFLVIDNLNADNQSDLYDMFGVFVQHFDSIDCQSCKHDWFANENCIKRIKENIEDKLKVKFLFENKYCMRVRFIRTFVTNIQTNRMNMHFKWLCLILVDTE